MNQPDTVIELKEMDALLGRSDKCMRHNGTVCLRSLLLGHCILTYRDLPTSLEKSRFSKAILNTIQQQGGRFLVEKQDESGWERVDDQKAKEKVAHMLRDLVHLKDFSLVNLSILQPSCYKSEYDFAWKYMVMKTVEHQQQQQKNASAASSNEESASFPGLDDYGKEGASSLYSLSCTNKESQEGIFNETNDTKIPGLTAGLNIVSQPPAGTNWDAVLPNITCPNISHDIGNEELPLMPLRRSSSDLSFLSFLVQAEMEAKGGGSSEATSEAK